MKKLFFGKKEKILSDKYEGLKFSLYTASFLLVIFLLVEVILLLYWSMLNFYYGDKNIKSDIVYNSNVQISPQKLKNNYLHQIAEVAQILAEANMDVASYQTVKDKLLSISVPREYLDWHFRLVVAVDKLLDYMILQANSPSREHEQLVSSQTIYINQYLTTIDNVGIEAREQ